MEIRFIGAESFGVRSMCTALNFHGKKVLIDPAVSLAPHRFGLPPHDRELQASKTVREEIMNCAKEAEIIVLSHYHFDHFTPFMKREYEWSDEEKAILLYRGKTILAKARSHHINNSQLRRSEFLFRRDDCRIIECDGKELEGIHFSEPVFHGEENSPLGFVVMAAFVEGQERFIFGSDTQCLNSQAVDAILSFKPTIAYVSGQPTYLSELFPEARQRGLSNLKKLAAAVPVLVVDHHLRRDANHLQYLSAVIEEAKVHGHKILSAAEFMGKTPNYLECKRKALYNR